jgi:hypothetical protein
VEVETLEVKPCPFCEAELRDSVIRCTRCGRSLLSEPEGAERRPARAGSSQILGAPTVSGGTRGSRIGFPDDEPVRPAPAVWAPTPARGPAPSIAPVADPSARRALPSQAHASWRPDLALLVASLAAVAAAILAWRAIGDPWVRLAITDTSDRLNPNLVGQIPLKGQAALLGLIGQGLAAVIGAYGVLWFLYGFDRGSTIPWFVSPAVAITAAIGGLVLTGMSAAVWFVWKDAAVEHARAVRMTAQELKALLDTQPEPLVEIARLSGLMRFGGAMVAGLIASSTAWWAYRKRG